MQIVRQPAYLLSWMAIVMGCALERKHFTSIIPPRSETRTTISVTEVRIRQYWKEYGRLPSSAAELAIRPDKSNSTTDGWGREIVWSQPDERTIRLSSLGKDGKPGGTGEDEDWQVDVVVDQENESDDAR